MNYPFPYLSPKASCFSSWYLLSSTVCIFLRLNWFIDRLFLVVYHTTNILLWSEWVSGMFLSRVQSLTMLFPRQCHQTLLLGRTAEGESACMGWSIFVFSSYHSVVIHWAHTAKFICHPGMSRTATSSSGPLISRATMQIAFWTAGSNYEPRQNAWLAAKDIPLKGPLL